MTFIGFIVTCLGSIVVGLCIQEQLLKVVLLSPLGFSGEPQKIKNHNLQRLLQKVSSAFGAGAGLVAFSHHADWGLLIGLILALCLLPAILFANLRVARLGAIALEKRLEQWISRPR